MYLLTVYIFPVFIKQWPRLRHVGYIREQNRFKKKNGPVGVENTKEILG